MTLESESGRVKREADKSYELSPDREGPDSAIEVIVTSGGIDKLEADKPLQIPEVWFWEKGQLSFYALGDEGYENILQSQILRNLDVALLMRCINLANHTQALAEFRQGIQS
ncbi:hypothetical protein [Microseira sp. BLCC-F43]|jgi:hypothetical protein|uniref:hypothetical protein n=1 Tax=Microseira sp. BLCC-F43 TaxID=3153602 RepID=UPI0035B9AD30